MEEATVEAAVTPSEAASLAMRCVSTESVRCLTDQTPTSAVATRTVPVAVTPIADVIV